MSSSAGAAQFASALSTADTTADAAAEVCRSLSDRLGPVSDLAIAFATAHHTAGIRALDAALAQALRPAVRLVMSAGGVIGVGQEVEQGPGLSVLAGRLPGVALHPFRADVARLAEPGDSAQVLREQVGAPSGGVAAIILLADPFSTPQQELVDALGAAYPAVPVVGGMASAARRGGQNRLGLDGHIESAGAIGVALGTGVSARATVSQGCRPIGRPLLITKATGNVIEKLGGRSAYEVAREVVEGLDEQDRRLVAGHALFLGRVIDEYRDRFGRGDFLVRNILGVDPNLGHLAVSDPHIRVGQTVQFQVRDATTAAEDLALLLDIQKLHGPARGALLFSCNGRGAQLFGGPHADAQSIRAALGDVPLAGCFAMGEIGPVAHSTFLHGHTASLLVLRDGDPSQARAAEPPAASG